MPDPARPDGDATAAHPGPAADPTPPEGRWLESTGEAAVPPYVGGSTATPRDGATTATGGAHAPTATAAGTVVARRYRLVRPLGEGGMGSVHLAEQTEPVRRTVALKLIKPGMDSVRVLARFEAERQALALMDHPNIARVLDAGTTDSARPFFVMEVVDGPPLTTYCDDRGLGVRERLALFADVCRAVQHAHQKGVIHRDLKPSNILVAESDGRPVPKVIDFGLAKALGGGPLTDWSLVTAPGSVLGTPLYMAPEQAGGGPGDVDTRADVYALGAVLYELLTGTTPIRRERLGEVGQDELLRAVREEEPEPPSARLRSLRAPQFRELDWVTLRALEKDRDRRYEGAGALADDVARYLANEPVAAAPASRWYRARKFVRRNRGPVVAAALVFAALVAGTVGTAVGFVREADQRREAEVQRGEAETQRDRAVTAEGVALQRLADVTREKQRADEEADIAREVTSVLQNDILQAANTRLSRDAAAANLRLRDVLDRASEIVGERFRGKPRVEVSVRGTIGKAYANLGYADRAIPHLERSFELSKSLHGPTRLDTLAVMCALGTAYYRAGKTDLAVGVLTEHLRLMREFHGPTHAGTITGMNDLALALLQADRVQEALKLFEEAVAASAAALGADHEDTLVCVVNFAHNLARAGETEKALPMLEDAVGRMKKVFDAGHPDVIDSLVLLADAQADAGNFPRAVAVGREAAESAEGKYGLAYPRTVAALRSLARAHRAAGDPKAAVTVFERRVAAARATYGEGHREVWAALHDLGDARARSGDRAGAAAEYARALELARTWFGREDQRTVVSLNQLGAEYQALGRWPEAADHFEQAVALAKVVWGVGDRQTRLAMLNLARAYRQTGRPDDARRVYLERLAAARADEKALPPGSPQLASELLQAGSDVLGVGGHADAEPILRECVGLCEKVEPRGWAIAHARSMLGGALAGRGKFEEAEPLLIAGYRGLVDVGKSLPPGARGAPAAAADRLCQLYTAWGKPDEAAKWRAERALYGPEVAPPPRPRP